MHSARSHSTEMHLKSGKGGKKDEGPGTALQILQPKAENHPVFLEFVYKKALLSQYTTDGVKKKPKQPHTAFHASFQTKRDGEQA